MEDETINPASLMALADEDESSKVNLPSPPPFLEVTCKSSGRKTRYAAGTKAGFAVNLINRKLDFGSPLALYIEAVREGEDPISFGPDAALVDYGNGWKLQTVTDLDYAGGVQKGEGVPLIPARVPGLQSSGAMHTRKQVSKPGISFLYAAKILLAFILIFVLGAIFTFALENLPRLILFINSSM